MRWQLALAQHPMYLIIKEDTICAERTPPWGEPDCERYIERVRHGLASVRKYPQLKMGFEWSGYELELLEQDAPDVLAEMRALAGEGKVTFYNGTYAQPHLQTLSSESCWRQYEYGQDVYRRMFGRDVTVYQHQESSIHDQVPQLLRLFGYHFAVLPDFFWTLSWLDQGELFFHGLLGMRFVQGQEFVTWQGLDGSSVPLYLQHSRSFGVRFEPVMGSLQRPPIHITGPDMVALDEAWLQKRSDMELVDLEDALSQRLAQYPPRARVRLRVPWSYIEGIRAEELSRSNWRAEAWSLRAEALDALAFTLLGQQPHDVRGIWKAILASQHHDAYCFSGPELKGKAINWLHQAESDAHALAEDTMRGIAGRMQLDEGQGLPLVVFGTSPHAQSEVVSTTVPVDHPAVIDPEGKRVPVEAQCNPDGGTQVRFLATLPGLGYATYRVQSGGQDGTEAETDAPFRFENECYDARIDPDGTFTSLVLKATGDELLRDGALRGNQLRGMDTTGVSPRHDGVRDVQLMPWEPPQGGHELHWQPTAPARVRTTPLGATLAAVGRLGERVNAEVMVSFYHQLPRIDLTYTFDFTTACIGTFFDDESKLRVCWPLAFPGRVWHDIAFGAVEEQPERPFFPASWVDVSDGRKGLAYMHQGTPKHWLRDRTLFNLFAWGEDTDAIGNRLQEVRWSKAFDQRLCGRHVIHSAVLPHAGDWCAANLVGAARSFGMPPLAHVAAPHPGDLAGRLSVLALTDPNLAATALRAAGGQVLCRVYAAQGKPATAAMGAHGLTGARLRAATGDDVQSLQPFQIGELRLRPQE